MAAATFLFVSVVALLSTIDPTRAIWYAGLGSLPTLALVSQTRGRRSRALDLLVIVFLATAAVGIWTSYDPTQATLKAARLLIAVLLMAAVLQIPYGKANFILVALGILGVGLTLSFTLLSDPAVQSADFEVLSRARQWLATLTPGSKSTFIDPNILAGVLIFTAPILLTAGIWGIVQSRPVVGATYLLLAAIQLIGLVLTSSRGAWLALSSAPIILVVALAGLQSWRKRGRSRAVVIIFITVSVLLVITLLTFGAPILGRAIQQVPGAPTLGERVGLYKDTLDLISDYAYTGGGLAAFSGLYSTYIRVIPFRYFSYSHSLYLDLALEQGIFGLVAALGFFAVVLRACMSAIAQRRAQGRPVDLLAWGALIGFIAMLIHGLGDDPLYGLSGTPLIFLPPALALYFLGVGTFQTGSTIEQPEAAPEGEKLEPSSQKVSVLILLLILAIVGGFWRILSSGVAANLAALKLSKVELAGWEAAGRDDIGDLVGMDEILAGFQTALRLDPDRVTALYRSGHIALSQLEFDQAVAFLKHAHMENPSHRGITKQLGYALIWEGKVERGVRYLQSIPEAREELLVYSWWWTTQDESELSLLASEAAGAMDGPANQSNP